MYYIPLSHIVKITDNNHMHSKTLHDRFSYIYLYNKNEVNNFIILCAL